MIGLDETAKRAWEARKSPRLRAWATQQLDKCGRPDGKRAQVQCLLDAWRAKVPYVADPKMVEFIAHPEHLLCLGDGLCIVGSDCEEHALGMAAAVMSVGIDAMIVGQSSHEPADVPSHVYFAFKDDLDNWVRADATTPYAVGKVAPYLKEWWIDPAKGIEETGMGDFVALGAPEEGPSEGLGDEFQPHVGHYAGLFQPPEK